MSNNWKLRHVWEDVLLLADADGVVDCTVEAFARKTGWPFPLAELRDLFEQLEAEDPDSRNPELGGRRLIRLEDHRAWGWQIANFAEYRELNKAEVRRARNRERQARRRAKLKGGEEPAALEEPDGAGRDGHAASHPVTLGHADVTEKSRQAEADTEAYTEETESKDLSGSAGRLPGEEGGNGAEAEPEPLVLIPLEEKPDPEAELERQFAELWQVYPRKEKRADALRNFRRAVQPRRGKPALATVADFARAVAHYRAWFDAADPELEHVMMGSTFFHSGWPDWRDGNPRARKGGSKLRELSVGSHPEPADPEAAEREALELARRDVWTRFHGSARAFAKGLGPNHAPSDQELEAFRRLFRGRITGSGAEVLEKWHALEEEAERKGWRP